MDEPVGAQYAVQIALHTLKERCRSLQQRVAVLEEENLTLRVHQCKSDHTNVSLSELDKLKTQIAELTEHKQQLQNKIRMVANENQDLWTRLSKLTRVNQNLGMQLSKINDSLIEYTEKNKEPHSPLIRSKTFTQDEPHTKVLQRNLEENGKICSELEEISLKIINSFAQGKSDLDSLYSEIADLQCGENIISDSCGFYYDEYDDDTMDNFRAILQELKATKEVVQCQKTALQLALDKIVKLQEIKSICDRTVLSKEVFDKSTSTLPDEVAQTDTNVLPDSPDEVTRICPMCCKNFANIDFQLFQEHVEKHFSAEHNFELL